MCGIFLVFISSSYQLAASVEERLEITLQTPRNYEVEYYTAYKIDKNTLMNICFDYNHIRKYLPNRVTIEVVEDKGSEHTITYHAKMLFYSTRSTYVRTLHPEKNTIFFEMIDFHQNFPLFPEMKKSRGYYEFTEHGEEVALYYYQMTELNKNVSESDLKSARKQIRLYFKNLKRYIEEVKAEDDSQN